MPKIATYDAPQGLGLHPTEIGINATAQAARRVQGEYNEAAGATEKLGHAVGSAVREAGDAAVKYVEHKEVAQGAVTLAAMHSLKTRQWNDALKDADPNDPSVAPQFMEGLEDDLQKFGDHFYTEGGQKWAQTRVAAFREHMTQKTAADQAQMAGHAAVINTTQTLNHLSNTVRDDPSSARETMELWNSSFEQVISTSPTLTATQVAQLRQSVGAHGQSVIARSALSGMVEKNPGAFDTPEKARKIVTERGWDTAVTGEQVNALVSQSRSITRYNRIDESLRRKQQDEEDGARSDAAELSLRDKLYGGQKITTRDINRDVADNPLSLEARRRLTAAIEHEANRKEEKVHSNPEVAAGLRSRLLDDTNPTTAAQVIEADIKGDLSKVERNDMLHLVDRVKNEKLHDPGYTAAVHAAREAIVHGDIQVPGVSALLKDAKGQANYADFLRVFTAQYLALTPEQRAGALNFKNENSLINQTLNGFKRSFADRLKDLDAAMQGAKIAPPGAPGKEKPPADIAAQFPDAFKGSDGRWYTVREGKTYPIIERK